MAVNKKIEVIMLPTTDKTKIISFDRIDRIDFAQDTDILLKYDDDYHGLYSFKHQHLYFISDDHPEVGDWATNGEHIFMIVKPWYKNNNKMYTGKGKDLSIETDSCRKIIATTDIHLKLPKPSKAFIEKYCDKQGIDHVLVDYTYDIKKIHIGWNMRVNHRPIVNLHNEITIRPVKTSWNIEDLTGNGESSLDAFLLDSPIYTQEERELIMEAMRDYTYTNHHDYNKIHKIK